MTPEEMVAAALEVAREGLNAGELPIGAVVMMGEEVVGRAFTQDRAQRRMLAHADLAALVQADELLRWERRAHPLRMAVNLEPCVMCLGAVMSLGVAEVYYGLESPADGAARIAQTWDPGNNDLPGYGAPLVVGGILRHESRELFREFCESAPESGVRRWARTLVDLPD
ncbi:hypothetical protein GCM10009839_08870 [Catenulispora yoronensis]|uniref:CMP/dCMP-type deaminase domain-containing protein n=1 Tax=Catenulispora yoronensis TaxID=450799 RepID=A0ABN2TPA1_9ACTN